MASLESLSPLERELEIMRRDKEKCQNELQKLKDMVGFSQGSDNYRARRSYLPESGPLVDTVRQLQNFFRMQSTQMGSPHAERARHNLNSTIEEVADATSGSCGVFAQEGCSELAE